jgi:hypothetical protein
VVDGIDDGKRTANRDLKNDETDVSDHDVIPLISHPSIFIVTLMLPSTH